jgi:hypothetical protein
MLTKKQKDQYSRDGYLLVPNILTAEQVRWLRGFFRPKFDAPGPPPDSDHWLVDIFGRYPEVRWLCFHEPTLKVLHSLFGDDIVLLPEGTAHFNYFGDWHKDTGSFDRAGLLFFKEKNFLQWTIAYYLQDNTLEYGGGLDVEPGSHREADDPFIKPPPFRRRSILERIWHQLDRRARRQYWQARNAYCEAPFYEPDPRKVVSVPSLAGDMVIFDPRVNHHATPARGLTPEKDKLGFKWMRRGLLPFEREKLAIYSSWSRDNSTARAYMEWTRTRWEYPHLRDFSYPADFLKDAQKAGVKLLY